MQYSEFPIIPSKYSVFSGFRAEIASTPLGISSFYLFWLFFGLEREGFNLPHSPLPKPRHRPTIIPLRNRPISSLAPLVRVLSFARSAGAGPGRGRGRGRGQTGKPPSFVKCHMALPNGPTRGSRVCVCGFDHTNLAPSPCAGERGNTWAGERGGADSPLSTPRSPGQSPKRPSQTGARPTPKIGPNGHAEWLYPEWDRHAKVNPDEKKSVRVFRNGNTLPILTLEGSEHLTNRIPTPLP